MIGMMGFDLRPILDNWSNQAIILLSIIGIVMLIVGFATQGFARAILSVGGVFLLIVAILLLLNAKDIGTELKDLIFKAPTQGAGMILPWKGALEPWNITTRESLSNLSRFIR